MEHQTLLNFLFGTVSAILGWFARELWSLVKSMKDELHRLREEIATERVHKDDFRHALDKVEIMLEKIFSKLDQKADR
jgi:hypothetical protein